MWKVCKLCNNYAVSDDGMVKRVETGKVLKQRLRYDNYLSVSISMGSRNNVKTALVHRLVAEAFIPNPENKPQVNHKDGNTTNNCVSNLEWVTNLENQLHARQTGLKPDDKGSNSPNSKLSDDDIQYCRAVYQPRHKLYGCNALAKQFNVSKSTMSYILNNRTYIPR